MKTKVFLKRGTLGLLAVSAFALSLAHCGTRLASSSNGAFGGTPLMPQLLQVSNGTTLGFYTSTGGFGFKTETASVLTFPSTVTVSSLDVNTTAGISYFGTVACTTNCDSIFYVNAATGQYDLGGVGSSTFALAAGGTSVGAAANPILKYLYVADSVSQDVTFLKATSLGYAFGNLSSSTFAAPANHSSQYVAVDSTTNVLLVTDPMGGSVYFLNASNGSLINTSSGQTIAMTGVSAGCTTASQMGQVKFNANNDLAYVLCGTTLTYFSMAAAPRPLTGAVSTSMFNTSGVSSPADFLYDSIERKVFVIGGSSIVGLDSQTGALGLTLDLSTLNCGSSLSLSGIAYSSALASLFVADKTNSFIYVLDPATLALKNGTCANSTFSTSADVAEPTHLSFF